MTTLRRHALLVVAVVVAIGVWVAQVLLTFDHNLGDLPVYEHTSRLIALGEFPYADFRLEYPPLAAGLFVLAGIVPGGYALGFSLVMLGCLLATLAGTYGTARALGLDRRSTGLALALIALAPIMLGPLMQTRYDLAVAALLAWIAYSVVTDRWRAVWVLVAVAVLVKLVPLAVIPVLVLMHRRWGPGRGARWGWLASLATIALGVAPFVIASPRGAWQMVAYHLDRPLQIESLGSSLLLGAHNLAGVPLRHVTSYGSDNLIGKLPDAMATLSSVAGLVLLVLVARSLYRALGVARGTRLLALQGISATLVALIATGKVLSPQYLVWLLPLVALVGGRRGQISAGLLAVAMIASQVIFPTSYRALTDELAAAPTAVLIARNLLLVALLVAVWPRRNTQTRSE
jgi:Glycosyltransferase family 87